MLRIQIVEFLQRRDYSGGWRGRDVEFVGVFGEYEWDYWTISSMTWLS